MSRLQKVEDFVFSLRFAQLSFACGGICFVGRVNWVLVDETQKGNHRADLAHVIGSNRHWVMIGLAAPIWVPVGVAGLIAFSPALAYHRYREYAKFAREKAAKSKPLA